VRTPPPAARESVTQCLSAVRLDRNRRTPVLPKKRGSGQEKPAAQRPVNAVSNGALTTLLRLVNESADNRKRADQPLPTLWSGGEDSLYVR